MKVETMGRVLIAIGALVMLYAQLVMPIALPGADVVNMHLISERQNTLILGGLLFLAGIVLFAVFKLKQTKEDEAIEEQETDDRHQIVKDKIGAAQSRFQNLMNIAFDTNGVQVNAWHDGRGKRIANGFVVGLAISLLLLREFGLLLAIAGIPLSMWIAFRPRPIYSVVKRLHLLNIGLAGLLCIYWFLYEQYLRHLGGTSALLTDLIPATDSAHWANMYFVLMLVVSGPFLLHATSKTRQSKSQ